MTKQCALDSALDPIPPEKPVQCEPSIFNQRFFAIAEDKSLTDEERGAAWLAMSEDKWVERAQPPLFVAALSLDPPEVKAAAVEAALRAGADPNELDHDFGKLRNHGYVLAFFVNWKLHYQINDGFKGMENNLPAIEILLRYGADPRLSAPFLGPISALLHARTGQERGVAPAFFNAVLPILEEAAARLDERDAQAKAKGLGIVGSWINRLNVWKGVE